MYLNPFWKYWCLITSVGKMRGRPLVFLDSNGPYEDLVFFLSHKKG